MLNNNDTVASRPRISQVRDMLNDDGCVSMNPFLRPIDRSALLDIFQEFARDVFKAGTRLEAVTGAKALAFGGANGRADFLAKGLCLDAGKGKSVDTVLSEAFLRFVSEPYFVLRDLEKAEAAGRGHCFAKAQRAMDGLAELHAFAKAVPLVYKSVAA